MLFARKESPRRAMPWLQQIEKFIEIEELDSLEKERKAND